MKLFVARTTWMSDLLADSIRACGRAREFTLAYLFFAALEGVCALVATYALSLVATDNGRAVALYAVARAAGVLAQSARGYCNNRLARQMSCETLGEAYARYATLSVTAEDKNPVAGYSAAATTFATTWSLFCGDLLRIAADLAMGLLTAAYAISLAGGSTVRLALAWLVPAQGGLAYLAWRAMRAMHVHQKARESAARSTRTATQIALQHMQLGHATVAEVMGCLSRAWPHIDAHRAAGRWLTGVLDISGLLLLAAALLDQGELLLFTAVSSVVRVVHVSAMFYCSLGDAAAARAAHRDFWRENGPHCLSDAPQHPLSELVTEPSLLRLGDGRREFSLIVPPLRVRPVDRVLIQGGYGSGKSTLMKGLLGLIPGVELAGPYASANYTKSWVYAPQTLTSSIPFAEVTVAQLFRSEDAGLITRAARIAGAKALFDESGGVDPQLRLTGTLSGGQRMAVAVATCLMELLRPTPSRPGPRWLALDECTTGMDPPHGYALLNDIGEAFPDVPMLVITHLENAETKCRWTHVLECAEGRVVLK